MEKRVSKRRLLARFKIGRKVAVMDLEEHKLAARLDHYFVSDFNIWGMYIQRVGVSYAIYDKQTEA